MNVLLTGAFGNIGVSTLEALLARGHCVRCFDLDTPENRRAAQRYLQQHSDRVEMLWGDLRRQEDVARAVAGQEVVVHLAFLIPKLSATGHDSEEKPDLAWDVNVNGTQNLLNAIRKQPQRPRIVFASSYHVYGPPDETLPCRTSDDPVNPIEHYARHKVACEWLVKASGLDWAILRFAATFPLSLALDPYMFEIPLSNRMEYLHTRDAGVAAANAVASPEAWGQTWLIGGGPSCQLTYGQIVREVMGALGIGMLPASAFGSIPFGTDWLDTAESQRLLNYQQRTLADYAAELRDRLGWRRWPVCAARPLVRLWLLSRSPYWRASWRGFWRSHGPRRHAGHPPS